MLVLGGGPVGVEMAQAVCRLGGEVALVDGAEHVLAREPAPLGEALGEVLRRDGVELVLGEHATAARREGEDYILDFEDGRELRGDRLLVATGRSPRVEGIGLETVGVQAGGLTPRWRQKRYVSPGADQSARSDATTAKTTAVTGTAR